MNNKKAIAVLTSDIHFNLQNLELSSAALIRARDTAEYLKVPLIIAGDLLDTKAIIRAEVANRVIDILDKASWVYLLVGNHDLVNEKGKEHALNFLRPYASIISNPTLTIVHDTKYLFIPYQTNPDDARKALNSSSATFVIMHQGIKDSNMGDYVQDHSAITKENVGNRRVISGHYHAAQDIPCGETGLFSYIGSPFTMSFGEANDPEKGFRVLFNDGSLATVPLELRRHIVYTLTASELQTTIPRHGIHDLVWLKIKGTREELEKGIPDVWKAAATKITLLAEDQVTQVPEEVQSLSQVELLDSMIDSITNASNERKEALKSLWRSVL